MKMSSHVVLGFPPDQPDPVTKVTALHAAVESSNLRAIQLLLQSGAQVNLGDTSLSTPLHIAASMGSEEVRLSLRTKTKRKENWIFSFD